MIKIENLTKTYNLGKSNAFTALKDVSVEIPENTMTAVIGKSGAGKSTLLHIVGCIDSFEKGTYTLDGTEVSKLKQRELSSLRCNKIGIVMQDFALIEEYTVLENVKIPLFFSTKHKKNHNKLALDALAKVGIDDLAKKKVSQLSGGQKQRTAIARAIVNEPSVILADEPTGALDTKNTDEIMKLFRSLNGSGKSIIIITHDPYVASLCDSTIELSDGKTISSEEKKAESPKKAKADDKTE